ncbi:hypothetical protein TorRG33x02_207300 [Trema orientale]|uniref:Uncharacterized protein n=1 Tax=Trema orientale TaxID=63057 RepID=A0A2P5ED51_TREOI|nr:hypothetical protein TorRG33x02_207300 [Trema orientale]
MFNFLQLAWSSTLSSISSNSISLEASINFWSSSIEDYIENLEEENRQSEFEERRQRVELEMERRRSGRIEPLSPIAVDLESPIVVDLQLHAIVAVLIAPPAVVALRLATSPSP